MKNIPDKEPNYKQLYEAAVLEIELLQRQLALKTNEAANLDRITDIQAKHLRIREKEIKELKTSSDEKTTK
jgi:hypothetical protein